MLIGGNHANDSPMKCVNRRWTNASGHRGRPRFYWINPLTCVR